MEYQIREPIFFYSVDWPHPTPFHANVKPEAAPLAKGSSPKTAALGAAAAAALSHINAAVMSLQEQVSSGYRVSSKVD